MDRKATVLVPTHDHALLLPYAIRSALAQTVEDIEIFVVGDGVKEDTRDAIAHLMKEDRRIRFFDNPKGPRHGEIHRHAALLQARGEVVCYLCDDDLWMPHHVDLVRRLLGEADVANAMRIFVETDGTLSIGRRDYSVSGYRRRLLQNVPNSGTGLTFMAHTLRHYRRLQGWISTPAGVYTDQFFLRQTLLDPTYRASCSTEPSALRFGSSERARWTMQRRVQEMELWTERIQMFASARTLWSMSRNMAQFYDRPGESQTLKGLLRRVRTAARRVYAAARR